jgi:hypothetical protein
MSVCLSEREEPCRERTLPGNGIDHDHLAWVEDPVDVADGHRERVLAACFFTVTTRLERTSGSAPNIGSNYKSSCSMPPSVATPVPPWLFTAPGSLTADLLLVALEASASGGAARRNESGGSDGAGPNQQPADRLPLKTGWL